MKILVCGSAKWTDSFFSILKEEKHDVTFVLDERIPLKEQNIDPSGFEIVICNGLFLYNDVKEFISLKTVQLTSVGFDRVPIEYMKEHDIRVFNARGVYSIPMAEYAIFGVLSLYKKGKELYKNQLEKKWIKQRDVLELFNKTVCIVGCGNVGQEVAKRFSAFGCKIIGVDIFPINSDLFIEKFSIKEIDKGLSISDIVVLTLPLTKETEGMFNENMFSKMKESSVFVNIARGKIVKEDALISALKNKLYGAVLDVFESEPLDENSELWNLENVLISPHNSFVGDGNIERLEELVLENIEKWKIKK